MYTKDWDSLKMKNKLGVDFIFEKGQNKTSNLPFKTIYGLKQSFSINLT